MLEKQPGNPLIHRLRIIFLLEADFNIALRIIWMRRLFPAADKMGFSKEQWGSRKNRNSTDCATMKLLTFESYRHRRTWIAMMAMDAAAYYDRIITYLSNVCERRHGLPKNACIAKGKTVFEMIRKVRTAYGESNAFYTSVGDDLMHGVCQGRNPHHQAGKFTPPVCSGLSENSTQALISNVWKVSTPSTDLRICSLTIKTCGQNHWTTDRRMKRTS